ncbi:MAG: RNA polymerase sigma factor [Clostridia bacterium]|nr:RNA polymerase sigma factor [Oscillospiraceae bacterium]MBQ7005220.1 RNA polymerase sigma factor [Clostridia bacterium]
MSSNVENLVKKSKEGDTAAFGDLYEIYSTDMFRFAYYYTGSTSAAEDCVSEAVLIAFRKIGDLKNISSFKSWLFRILRNCCNANHRKVSKEAPGEEIRQSVHSFEKESDDKLSLGNALLRLTPEDREIIILHYCNGYTSREISLMLSMNENTVRSRILRGTEKLRNELKDGE